MRFRIFYGWYIVAALVLLSIYHSGIMSYGFTAFIAPIAATFGWSYAQISFAVSVRGMEMGALDPLVGIAADRWPARRLMLLGVIVYGLGILCISQAINLPMFYLGFLLIGLGTSLSITMIPQVMVARWFKKDVGKASGIMTLGFGIGGALIPLLVTMIDTYGWQTSLLILAAGLWIIGIPISFIFRTRPEEYNLVPDGKPSDNATGSSSIKTHDFSKGVKEAFKMRPFWHLSIAYMLHMAGAMAVVTHVMPYLSSLGVDRPTASMIAMFIPLVSLPARIGFGWLADTFTKKNVAAISQFLASAGLFIFWLIDGSSLGLIIAFVCLFSLGQGGMVPTRISIAREYFGTKRFGTIYGLMQLFVTTGIIISPPVAGWVFDTLGVYDPIWLILSGAAMIGAILTLTIPPASRRPDSIAP